MGTPILSCMTKARMLATQVPYTPHFFHRQIATAKIVWLNDIMLSVGKTQITMDGATCRRRDARWKYDIPPNVSAAIMKTNNAVRAELRLLVSCVM